VAAAAASKHRAEEPPPPAKPEYGEVLQGFVSENPNSSHQFGMVRLAGLVIDPAIQREENPVEIRRIAAEFNPAALGTITISRRVIQAGDGTPCELCGQDTTREHLEMVLVDGQQRRAAALRVGYDEPVHADVHDGLTRADEARLFRQLNFRTPVTPIVLFKTQLVEQNPHVLAVQAILDGLGIKFGTSKGYSAAGGSVSLIQRTNGVTHLEWALRQTKRLWDRGEGGVYGAGVVEALFRLHERDGNLIDERRLYDKLANDEGSNNGLVEFARSLQRWNKGSLTDNIIRAIIDLYNKNLSERSRARLDDWKPKRKSDAPVVAGS
jgi:hypothetical protein